MIEYITGIMVLMSAFVILVASVGIIRFDTMYARMHIVSKISSLALLLLLIAVNLKFWDLTVAFKSLVIFHVVIFLIPVAAHVIARISKLLEQDGKRGNQK